MPNYRRLYLASQSVFITIVTNHRKRIFIDPQNIEILFETINRVKIIYPFELIAYVVMPEHLHCLIQTPDGTPNYSPVIHCIKRNFALNFKKVHHIDSPTKLWQARFWDHVIKDDNDFEKHLDYIHWNPVKHGYVNDPLHWQWSTFSKWFEDGFYDDAWGVNDMPSNIQKMDFE
jgi:putative transposase